MIKTGKLLALLLMLGMCGTAQAWNARGHAAVATLAEENLKPEALRVTRQLLEGDLDALGQPSGRHTLAAIASWPDEIRSEETKTNPDAYKGWHVRSNQVCSDKLGACKNGACVDQLIMHYTAILADASQAPRARNEALKWVVHLVGDLHQPLHSGINRNGGGARVLMEGLTLKSDETLHTVWDGRLLNAALKDWKSTARLSGHEPHLAADAPTQWMIEARGVALRDVYQPLSGFVCSDEKLPEPFMLDAGYQQHSVPVVRQQVERAGLRLAQLLNEALAP